MGCDIHMVLEFKDEITGKWIGEFTSDNYNAVGKDLIVARRDYYFFAEIAGVRGIPSREGFYAKGLPKDISELARSKYMEAPTDNHSASHLTPKQFCNAWLRCNELLPHMMEDFITYELLGAGEEQKYRVVFWFDN